MPRFARERAYALRSGLWRALRGDEPDFGKVGFFDMEDAPPRSGRPMALRRRTGSLRVQAAFLTSGDVIGASLATCPCNAATNSGLSLRVPATKRARKPLLAL